MTGFDRLVENCSEDKVVENFWELASSLTNLASQECLDDPYSFDPEDMLEVPAWIIRDILTAYHMLLQ